VLRSGYRCDARQLFAIAPSPSARAREREHALHELAFRAMAARAWNGGFFTRHAKTHGLASTGSVINSEVNHPSGPHAIMSLLNLCRVHRSSGMSTEGDISKIPPKSNFHT